MERRGTHRWMINLGWGSSRDQTSSVASAQPRCWRSVDWTELVSCVGGGWVSSSRVGWGVSQPNHKDQE